ncbi:MAG TPA: ribosome biogenesis factor YjgA [Oleiagrimonas sp.]|nr:ribosome biogenesis factor YjgA [Oleiagrimonas sp.]
MDETRPEPETEGPSRSQRRREALDTLALAEQLVALTPARTAPLELPEDIAEEVVRTRAITARGAHKRQLAYLAKLMRRHDDDAFATARAVLNHDRQHQREEAAVFQRIEALREKLLGDDKDALTTFIDQHPQVDRQHLNALVRQARAERKRDKPPRAARELFRLLRDLPSA